MWCLFLTCAPGLVRAKTQIDAQKSVVLVVALEGQRVGLLVDAVSDILDVERQNIKGAPKQSEVDIEAAYIRGLISANNTMVILLHTERLFDSNTLAQADRAAGKSDTEIEG
jgi:purine-binding chemotaxis protein CheW